MLENQSKLLVFFFYLTRSTKDFHLMSRSSIYKFEFNKIVEFVYNFRRIIYLEIFSKIGDNYFVKWKSCVSHLFQNQFNDTYVSVHYRICCHLDCTILLANFLLFLFPTVPSPPVHLTKVEQENHYRHKLFSCCLSNP